MKVRHCPDANFCAAAKRSASGSLARTRGIDSMSAVEIARSRALFSSGLGKRTVGKIGSGSACFGMSVVVPRSEWRGWNGYLLFDNYHILRNPEILNRSNHER